MEIWKGRSFICRQILFQSQITWSGLKANRCSVSILGQICCRAIMASLQNFSPITSSSSRPYLKYWAKCLSFVSEVWCFLENWGERGKSKYYLKQIFVGMLWAEIIKFITCGIFYIERLSCRNRTRNSIFSFCFALKKFPHLFDWKLSHSRESFLPHEKQIPSRTCEGRKAAQVSWGCGLKLSIFSLQSSPSMPQEQSLVNLDSDG